MLLFVPGRTNAKIRTPMREHIKCCRRLDKNAWVAIGDTSNHGTKFNMVGTTGSKCQCAPPLQHLMFCRADKTNLEKVVHDPEAIETGALSTLGNKSKSVSKLALIL